MTENKKTIKEVLIQEQQKGTLSHLEEDIDLSAKIAQLKDLFLPDSLKNSNKANTKRRECVCAALDKLSHTETGRRVIKELDFHFNFNLKGLDFIERSDGCCYAVVDKKINIGENLFDNKGFILETKKKVLELSLLHEMCHAIQTNDRAYYSFENMDVRDVFLLSMLEEAEANLLEIDYLKETHGLGVSELEPVLNRCVELYRKKESQYGDAPQNIQKMRTAYLDALLAGEDVFFGPKEKNALSWRDFYAEQVKDNFNNRQNYARRRFAAGELYDKYAHHMNVADDIKNVDKMLEKMGVRIIFENRKMVVYNTNKKSHYSKKIKHNRPFSSMQRRFKKSEVNPKKIDQNGHFDK